MRAVSYYHTCLGCAIDQTRRRYDEPDRGTLCEGCSWSGALAYAIRLFWQGVCEQDAMGFDDQAARCEYEARMCRAHRPSNDRHEADAVIWDERAAKSRARAAELRAWASGKESKPIYECCTRPLLAKDLDP